jgi:hypothetical protein
MMEEYKSKKELNFNNLVNYLKNDGSVFESADYPNADIAAIPSAAPDEYALE